MSFPYSQICADMLISPSRTAIVTHNFDRVAIILSANGHGNSSADNIEFSNLDVRYIPLVPGDFDRDGDVDGADFVA